MATAADRPTGGGPILLSPATFARFDEAAIYYETVDRTRDPRRGSQRWPGISPGAWGLLAPGATILYSYLYEGSGTVTLCDRHGTPLVPAQVVTVHNAGAAISGGSTGRIVPLEWTDGVWSVCGCADTSSVTCLPCPLPARNLTLSWVNSLLGNGSTALVYSAPSSWTSACVNQLRHSLVCAGGQIQYGITAYPTSSCTTGPTQTCVSPGRSPSLLIFDSYTCSPLYLHYNVTLASCSTLYSRGYTAFAITA